MKPLNAASAIPGASRGRGMHNQEDSRSKNATGKARKSMASLEGQQGKDSLLGGIEEVEEAEEEMRAGESDKSARAKMYVSFDLRGSPHSFPRNLN
ncbi:hypothetical protein H0H92_014061 [Tricholoma furcatifolium]|nr:hypothetical protein H0H92_014061 [Tricholoma furcatifolium]